VDKLGGVFATLLGIGILMVGFRPAWDVMYDMMNTTGTGLTNIEGMIWRFAPLAIILGAVVGGIIILAQRRGQQREGETRW